MAVVALIMGLVGIFQTRKVPLQGPQGPQGIQGIQGESVQGPQGIQGKEGKQGPSGAIGMPLQLGAASGYAHQQKESFLQGLTAGVRDQFSLTNAGVLSTSGSGNFHRSFHFCHTLTQGGGIRATSTVNSAETLLAADFDVENVIAYTLNVQDATLTLPASSTLSSFIPTAGQERSIFIRNASTTAAMDLTLAGGTGMNLLVASSTKVIVGNTSGSNSARLDFVRRADTDIDVTMSIFLK